MKNEELRIKNLLTRTARAHFFIFHFSFFIFQFSILNSQTVEFSLNGWFYREAFSLKLMHHGVPANTGHTIHYTLDGSEPSATSPQYSEPLMLSAGLYSSSNIYRIQNAPDDNWYCPADVERIIVVRAALFDSAGQRLSPVNTQSYIVSSLIGRTIQLPVVSICTDSASLFNPDTGIALRGNHYNPSLPNSTGNYFQRGREWERKASFAFYDPDGGIPYTQDCGLRMHGSSQRARSQKGFSLYARRQYGDSRFRHDFFNTGNTSTLGYRRLVLRPWRTSWSGAGIEDWLCQRLAAPLACDNLDTRPVVLFLNGEYWGIYFLEEKADEYYIEEHYDIDHSWVNLLSGRGDFVEHGSGEGWDELTRWLEHADLSDPEAYSLFASRVDIDALLDYMILQILVCNADWPANNVRIWSAPGEPMRWIFFDGDGTLAKYHSNSYILNNLVCDDSTQVYPSSPQATLLFRRLLANPGFLQRSIERLDEMANNEFNTRRSSRLLEEIVSQVEDEVPYQIARFNYPRSINRWHGTVETIADFLKTRPSTMIADYIAMFGGGRERQPWLAVNPATGREALHYETQSVGKATLTIYDVYGRVAHSSHLSVQPGANVIDIPPLPCGRYFAAIDSSQTKCVNVLMRKCVSADASATNAITQ